MFKMRVDQKNTRLPRYSTFNRNIKNFKVKNNFLFLCHCLNIKNQPKLKFHIFFSSIVAFLSEVVFIDMKYN